MKLNLKHPIFLQIGEISDKLNLKTNVVGGFVRDFMMNGSESFSFTDLDFVCEGNGLELAQAVATELGVKKVSVFKNFGTAHLTYKNLDLEFVGARKESYRGNSRNPSVELASFEQDQERRDFTINAMGISLNKKSFGELIDPFNGQKDIEDKIIKTPLNPRVTFDEDPLRMLRAIRFAARFHFSIDDEVLAAMKDLALRMSIISQERITEELNKMVLTKKPSIAFKHLFNVGILKIIFPEMHNLQGVKIINGIGHKDNFYHTLQVLDKVAQKSEKLWLRWAAILHDIAKPPTQRFEPEIGWTFHGHEDKGARMTKGIFKKMKQPLGDNCRYVQKLVQLHLRPISLSKENITDSAVRRLIFDAGDDIDDLLLLCSCDITTKNVEKEKRFLQNLALVKERITKVEQRDQIRNWQPPLNGQEIMDLFNIKPGKEVGLIKDSLKEAILDGELANNKKEAIKFAIEKGKILGLTNIKNDI